MRTLVRATPCFVLLPLSDRAAWRLSETKTLDGYITRSFYLATPDTKEVIRRRIDYLKKILSESDLDSGAYFSRRGFHINASEISLLSDAISDILLGTDFITRLISRLSNFELSNILRLAERIFLSLDIEIDEMVKARYNNQSFGSDSSRLLRALICEEKDRLDENENSFITNLFYTDPEKPSSPLLAIYILHLLQNRKVNPADDAIDSRFWLLSDLINIFEVCGIQQEVTLRTTRRLRRRKLVDELNPTTIEVNIGSFIAITERGQAHLDLAISSRPYFEQMALVTGLNENFACDEIDSLQKQRTSTAFSEIRRVFRHHLMKNDYARIQMPSSKNYESLRSIRRQVEVAT